MDDGACDLPEWVERLAVFSLVRVSTPVTMLRDLDLREPACVQLRGQLGALFREQRCLTGALSCEGCPESEACDFARVFDAEGSPNQTPSYWLQGVPAHMDLRRDTHGEPTLWMLERELDVAPFLGEALRRALLQLGRPPGTPLWKPALQVAPVRVERHALPRVAPASCWTIRARTPLDLRADDLERHRRRCPAAPEFSLLLEAAVRRLYRLAQEALPQRTWPTPRLPSLEGLHRVEGGLRRTQDRRYSHRQQKIMPLQGVVGELCVEGEVLEELSPLLGLLPILGAGKKTTMGFGWVELMAR
jgi:hypothetical protein